MITPRNIVSRVLAVFRHRRLDAQIDAEVQMHLELLVDEHVRRGMTTENARLAARRAFGGVEQMKEAYRDLRGLPAVASVGRDVRFAARLLLKERWFTAAAVAALALGIAANNVVFTLAYGIMYRELPFAEADRILAIGTAIGNSTRPNAGVSHPDLEDWRRVVRTLDGLGAVTEMTMNVADEDRAPERFTGSYISANGFDLIGRAPVLGRAFTPEDDRPGANPVVILGHTVWQNRYESDPEVLGRTIRVNGVPSVVIGVMAEGFAFPTRSRVWQPLALLPSSTLNQRDARVLAGIGRLRPGATREQAAAELRDIAATLAEQHPDTNRDAEPRVASHREAAMGGRLRAVFPLLMAMVGFVLLIACANVASLLLARASRRAREISVRLAIGASRAQIVRQLLVESALLASLAGLAGLALSAVGIRMFQNAFGGIEDGLPYWISFAMDWQVLAFLAIVCLGTAIAFGLVPALHVSRTNIAGVLNETSAGTAGALSRRRWTTRLVIAQLAVTPILLTGAGLMMRSVMAQQQIDAGVNTAGLVRMRVDVTGAKYPGPGERSLFYRQLEERLASDRSLRATLASGAPFEGAAGRRLSMDGRPAAGAQGTPVVRMMTIGTGYFEALGTRPVRGETVTASDGVGGPVPVVVNERFVEQHFAGQDPIGRAITLTAPNGVAAGPEQVRIVGVGPNIRQRSTEDATALDAIVYVPYVANPLPLASILVRSNAAPAAVAALVREHVAAIDPDLPLFDVMTLDESLARSDERIGLLVFGSMFAIFASIALVLATVGLYAVTAYATAQRTREFAVRLALGAQGREIAWLVTQRAARQLAIGLSVGMAGAVGLGQLLRGVLIGTSATDSVTLVGVGALLIVVTCVASLIPARHAVRLNPVAALRTE